MTHDKFCVYEMAPHLPESILKQSCMCERFAEARADEREQAAQRVRGEALSWKHHCDKTELCLICTHANCAIAAARGEDGPK